MKIQAAILIIASSETDSNLYYATKFLAPDPFIFLRIGEERVMIMSDLEVDRARDHAEVDTVLSYSFYEEIARKHGIRDPNTIDVLNEYLKERGIRKLVVPADFGIRDALILEDKGYEIEVRHDPFFEERLKKGEEEIEYLTNTLRHAEFALGKAIEYIGNSKVRDGYLYQGDRQVTSEDIKRLMAISLIGNDCLAQHTIVSCGEDTAFPHMEGHGPLKANVPIIIDLFPRSMSSRYYADITRTVVKGKASEDIKKMYEAVYSTQEYAMTLLKDGVNGRDVHEAVLQHFKEMGYESGNIGGRMQGFFHGTGHGVGLDIHEPPRISKKGDMLSTGNVVTVEPGLYYAGIGGVRLEDMVVIQKDGVVNLTQFPKVMEI